MKLFKDKTGREWAVDVTIGALKRIKDVLDVNLYEIESGDPPLATRLQTDLAFMVDVIYVVCKPQCDEKNVTGEQFGEALDGEAVLRARTAFFEALIDFFRQTQRPDRAEALAKATETLDAGIARALVEIAKLNPAEMVESAAASILRPKSGAPPASSGLTLAG